MPASVSITGFLLLIILHTSLVIADDPLHMKISPAWNAMVQAGLHSELNINLRAERGGQVIVKVLGSQLDIETLLNLQPGSNKIITMPFIYKKNTTNIRVSVQMPDGSHIEKDVPLISQNPTKKMLFVVTPGTSTTLEKFYATKNNYTLHHTHPEALPRNSQSYDVIDSLIINNEAIIRMQPQQLRALISYIEACGTLYLSGLPSEKTRGLRSRAGCGGTMIHIAEDLTLSTHAGILATVEAPIENSSLLQLLHSLEASSGTWKTIALFLAGYFLILLILFTTTETAIPVLLISPCAAVLLALVMSDNKAKSSIVSWAEMNSDEQYAQYSAVLNIEGGGKKKTTMKLPGVIGLPLPSATNKKSLMHWSARKSVKNRLEIDTHLLSKQTFFWHGSVRHIPSLTINTSPKETLIKNIGLASSPSSMLVWQGKLYQVPSLDPDQTWSPNTDAKMENIFNNSTLNYLLRHRARENNAALLIPFDLFDEKFPIENSASDGWLLIRASTEDLAS